MTTHTATSAGLTATLAPNAHDKIVFTSDFPSVTVTNNDASLTIYVSFDGTDVRLPGPLGTTPAGVTAVSPGASVTLASPEAEGTTLSLRSLGAASYTVTPLTVANIYAPILSPPATYTYNTDGTVATQVIGGVTTTYTWNTDGTIATESRGGVTRTFSYSGGNLVGVA